jgi:CubicO group peptidase (beta-lactamase class C family)
VVGTKGPLAWSGAIEEVTRWASVTKLFTAYATLMACQDGDLALDDAAGPAGSTVRHLLAHASGLPVEGMAPVSPPARKRIYSNRGYDLLGQLVAQATGMAFSEYLSVQLLEPLGIKAVLNGRPSEGLNGNVIAMARFAYELLQPSLLDPHLFQASTTVAFPGIGGILPGIGRFDPLDWGLGFELKSGKQGHWTGTTNSADTFGHFGGSGSFLWVDPVAGVAVTCLTGREFGAWALEAWPLLSDAVLAESRVLNSDRPSSNMTE